MTLEQALERLNGVKKTGSGYLAHCPKHDDKKQSLSLTEKDGKLLLHCFANCSFEDIIAALDNSGVVQAKQEVPAIPAKVVAVYDYQDEQGNVLYQVHRTDRKDFWQKKPNGENIGDTRRVLFRLPEVIQADTVFIVEGEKDVMTLNVLKITATTVSGGANTTNWKPDFAQYFKDKRVVLLPDNDKPGIRFMQYVAEQLLSVTDKVKLIELPGLQDKQDVTDWLQAGNTKQELLQLIAQSERITYMDIEAQKPQKGDLSSNPNTSDTFETTNPTVGKVEEWLPPIDIGQEELPEFPLEALPETLKDWVSSVAYSTQVPVEMPALTALGAIATAVQRKIVIELKRGYQEPLVAWAVVAMKSGNRKSSVIATALQPLNEYEREQEVEMRDEIAESQARYEAIKSEMESIKKDKKKNIHQKTEEIMELKKQLATHRIVRAPRLIADDATPEKLAALLSQHDEALTIASAESDIFQIITGRYSKGLNMELFLKAHAGDTVRVDRKTGKSIRLDNPALSMILTCQPRVLQDLHNIPQVEDRGLLARFWYAIPMSFVGARNTNPGSMSDSANMEYKRTIKELLSIKPQKNEYGDVAPYVLRMSPEAEEVYQSFAQVVEPQLAFNGELEEMIDWGSKLVGTFARIMGLIHMYEHSSEREPWSIPISEETAGKAWLLCDFLKVHALAAYGLMRRDSVLSDAEYLIRKVQTINTPTITQRQLFQMTKGRFGKVERLEDAIARAVEYGYLRANSRQTGGRPSRVIEINPLIVKNNTKDSYAQKYQKQIQNVTNGAFEAFDTQKRSSENINQEGLKILGL